MSELEKKLSSCEEEKMAAVKNYEAGQQQSRQQSDAHHKEMAGTTVTIDDLKMKVNYVYASSVIHATSINNQITV